MSGRRRSFAAGMVAGGGLVATLLVATGATRARDVTMRTSGAWQAKQEVVLPGTPEAIYDIVTGDVSPWWDHKFNPTSKRLYIEPKPGGGFYEIFNDAGDGVKHATVIYAERGKRIRFDGPFGFSGNALQMVSTYDFAPVGRDSTRLTVTVRAAGEIDKGWPEGVDGVWRHFLVERLKPYVEGKAKK